MTGNLKKVIKGYQPRTNSKATVKPPQGGTGLVSKSKTK
ncbi:hypothetical protein EDC14_101562 [Hydrogenispora ethanolica]|uniref:Uncharacterized protein n=1 Tax=Hydrogenispora ethanolica TaxID=1082276 RepID=A0A4R1RKH5_HYDET|nr:hypothetical protein EDC14_101562 [Hydrogenispora ethanolica]